MERAVIVAVAVIVAIVLYNKARRKIASRSRKVTVVRRMSEENVAEILKLPSVNDVCPCKTSRCAYKGKEHPKTVGMYRHGKKP